MKARRTTDNLCETCTKCIVDCGAENIEFGDAEGNDNVVECDEYEREQ